MSLMHSEYAARVNHWMRVLAEDFYRPLGEIAPGGLYHHGNTCPRRRPPAGPSAPFLKAPPGGTPGNTCGCAGRPCCPRRPGTRPWSSPWTWAAKPPCSSTGSPSAPAGRKWVSVPHHYLSDNVLTQKGVPGERFDLLFEVYAGHYYPDVGGCATGPVLPRHPGRSQGGGPPRPHGPQHLRHLERGRLSALAGREHPAHAPGRAARGLPARGENCRRPGGLHPGGGL